MKTTVLFIAIFMSCSIDNQVQPFPYKIKSAKYVDSHKVNDGNRRYVVVGASKEDIINALDTMGFEIYSENKECFFVNAHKDSIECNIQICNDTAIIRLLIGEFVN